MRKDWARKRAECISTGANYERLLTKVRRKSRNYPNMKKIRDSRTGQGITRQDRIGQSKARLDKTDRSKIREFADGKRED